MAHLVVWSHRAAEDLDSIAAYIAQDSEAYAASVVRTILHKCRVLSEFPLLGRAVPEFEEDTIREIFAYSYRVIYRVDQDEIVVAAIIHGKRQLDISLKP
jgi:plasmid stabilization system protein ParE